MNTIIRTLAGLVVGVSVVAGTVIAATVTPIPATAESVIAQAPVSGSAVSMVPAERGVAAEAVVDAVRAVKVVEDARQAAADQARKVRGAEESQASTGGLALTCEPHAAARLVGNLIVNKDCPELIAAKERAQREYAQQQAWSGNPGPPSEATQRQRIADGLAPVGGGYAPGSAEYNTCVKNPVASVCGG
ncbi:hypothetical protein AD006_30370 (plasmid) [Pseudonocardia sp. EC080610-09]|uniref:hypothetical protein n=1 Tax=unclassified Pseudonocardia TaxID=2619320 RepID=UPI000706120D|nr:MULTISPECIES: hypothetical protein [unclassified Pseudonocardia]ALL79531.1 hypothetical protein AD006_30370 [Pseudonocardia sp. EC080610-09]ALL85517.1 hypothetical protein AD017_30880 [Pseudonocardia sp. EC080619-01]